MERIYNSIMNQLEKLWIGMNKDRKILDDPFVFWKSLIEMKHFWQAVKFSNHSRVLEFVFKFQRQSGNTEIREIQDDRNSKRTRFLCRCWKDENTSFILFTGIGFIVSTFERGRITAFDTVSFRNSYFWCSTARLSPRRRTMKRSVDLVRLVFVCLLRKRARYAPWLIPLDAIQICRIVTVRCSACSFLEFLSR